MQNREAEEVWVGLKHIYFTIPVLPKDVSFLTYVQLFLPITLSNHMSSPLWTK